MPHDETRLRLPSQVAARLDISASTLRRWSKEFAPFLSQTAGYPELSSDGGMSHRRYTDEDLETLIIIKGLLAEGYSYRQVAKRLEAMRVGEVTQDDVYAVVATEGEKLGLAPAMAVLSDTIHTVADGQQMLLHSQQASRDLLGVLIQDNFNLKEENARLRERMLRLEREISEIKRKEDERRGSVEERLLQLELEQLENRKGCLGMLFGL
ncbi:MAG: MerR family transcriptional regulator [Anaerolineae bacterium]